MSGAKDKRITFQGNEAYAEYFQTLVFLNKSAEGYFFLWDYESEQVYFASDIGVRYALNKNIGEGYTIEDCMHMVYKRDLTKWAQELWAIHETEGDMEGMEFRLVDREGHPIWMSCRGKVIRDNWEKPLVMIGFLTDTDLLHQTDPLTGLMMTSKLFDVLEESIQKKEEGILLLLGVDNFKNLNKRYGRNRGNEILKEAARTLEKCVDSQFQIYRLDGDRFAVNFLGCNRDVVVQVYHKVQKKMEDICTFSGGGVYYPIHEAKDASTLFLYAESALDRAKKDGKNRLLFFSPQDYKKQLYLIELTEEMQKSIQNNFEGFSLRYQPQVRMNDYTVAGAEALLRYHSQKYGLVSPEEFIGLLEQNGMIVPVGAWVLKEGIHQCKEWRKLQPNFHMSLNLSYVQLKEAGLTEYIYQLLDEAQLPGGAITLELTESMQLEEYAEYNQLFYQWGTRGIEISIDDFGTGYSSLSYLKNLAIDEIKIDRCFVSNIHLSSYNYCLLNNIVELAKNAKIRVCCEGVETEAELHTLEQLMPGTLQGYYFSKPLEKKEFEQAYLFSHERQKNWEKNLQGRKNMVHEPVMDTDYKKILDLLDELIYVVDFDTYELYYMNPAAKRLTGCSDYTGKKCYSVIYGLEAPCPFCANEKMIRNHPVFHANDTELGRRMLTRNKIIPWKGELAKLEVGLELGMWDEKLSQVERGKEITEHVLSLIEKLETIQNPQQVLQTMLGEIGLFYQAQSSRLFLYSKQDSRWCGLCVWEPEAFGLSEETFTIPAAYLEEWREALSQGKGIVLDEIEQSQDYHEATQKLLDLFGARSLLLVPVLEDEKVFGLLCVENAEYLPMDTCFLEKMAPFSATLLQRNGLLDAKDVAFVQMINEVKNADILGAMKTGLWVIEFDATTQTGRMLVDKQMAQLLGITQTLTPEENFQFWYQRIQEEYKSYVDELLREMVLTGEKRELSYLWNHPVQGKIPVCSIGVSRQQKYRVSIIKGYHYQNTDMYHKETLQYQKIQETALRSADFYQTVLREMAAYAEVDLETGLLLDAGGLWSEYKEKCKQEDCLLGSLLEEQIETALLPEDAALCKQEITVEYIRYACMHGKTMLSYQFRYMMDHLSYHWMELVIHTYEEPVSHHIYALLYLKDIDAVKRHRVEREMAANRDPLTHVLTRRMFEYNVVQYMREETRKGEMSAILLFDISQLQKINDTMGHQTGDAVLARFADVLRHTFRKTDYIGRLGGDEFVVFLKAPVSKEMLDWRMQRLFERMQKKSPVELTCHIGIDFVQNEEFNYERNMHHAKKALKASCKKGPNVFVYYDELTEE